jgi:hypothetical protein
MFADQAGRHLVALCVIALDLVAVSVHRAYAQNDYGYLAQNYIHPLI